MYSYVRHATFLLSSAFVMQHYRNFGVSGGESDQFLMEPPKSTSLADFTRFELLRADPFTRFFR